MQGTVLHYDPLTRCGLLRSNDGVVRYFRDTDLVNSPTITSGQDVFWKESDDRLTIVPVSSVATGRDLPSKRPVTGQSVPTRADVGPYPSAQPVQPIVSNTGLRNIPATIVTAVAFFLLLVAGSGMKPGSRYEKNLHLVGSWFGVIAAVLLVIEGYLLAMGERLWRTRLVFWQIALCSGLAYVSQSCSGFVADTPTEWYAYALVVLLLILYILPYQRKY